MGGGWSERPGCDERRDRDRLALKEISLGRGPYRVDQLEHADSVIDTMKAVAAGALAGTWTSESTEAEIDEAITREAARAKARV